MHERGVARVEADAQTGRVRALRERVHRHHPTQAVFEDGAGAVGPRELHVALVAEHGHAVVATPGRGGAEVGQLAGGVAGGVDPEAEGAGRVGLGQVAQVGERHGPASGQHRAHLVGRVADRGVEHGVAIGRAQLQPLRQRGHELRGPDARGQRVAGHVDTQPPSHPAPSRVLEGGAAHRWRVPALTVGGRQWLEQRGGRWVAGRADGEVDVDVGLQPVQPLVRIGRRFERRGHDTTNSAKRDAPAGSSRARSRVASASWLSTITSPSRCSAATTSPRS